MKNCVIKLSLERLEGLKELYKAVLESDCTEVDDLVLAHAKEMHHHLKLLEVRGNLKNTLSLSVVECIALVRFWAYVPLPPGSWHFVVVKYCTDSAHKFVADQRSTVYKLN